MGMQIGCPDDADCPSRGGSWMSRLVVALAGTSHHDQKTDRGRMRGDIRVIALH